MATSEGAGSVLPRVALVTDVKWNTDAARFFAPFFYHGFRIFRIKRLGTKTVS